MPCGRLRPFSTAHQTAISLSASAENHPIEVTSAHACGVGELAYALQTFHGELAPLAHYLSALLLDQKTELPIPARNSHTFGSFAVLQAQPDGELKAKSAAFMAFRNALRVLYKRIALPTILARHGASVVEYGAALLKLCDAQPDLKTRLDEYERDARMLASAEPQEFASHTSALLADLAAANDWALLREQSQRHIDSADVSTSIEAKRMLALSLAHSEEQRDKQAAIDLYRSVAADGAAKISDIGNLATLLVESERIDEAKAVVLDGIRQFPANQRDHLLQVGQRIVEAAGDREFRKQMETAGRERGNRG